MQGCNSERLALRPMEAAKAIGVSARTLWTLTKNGQIPHKRIGRTVLYSVEILKAWLREHTESKACL